MILGVMLLAASCDTSDDAARSATNVSPSASPSVFETGRMLLDTRAGSRYIDVEIADDDVERATGLMGRTELPDDFGMVFVYFEDTRSPFYMKNTLVPLSIAFFDVNGRVVEILDMEPCRRDPCPLYHPASAYRGALEVEQGSFEEWGVAEGDLVRLTR